MRQVNVVGPSPLSQPSRVIQTLQAPPDVAPGSVTVRTASETSLWLRWVVSSPRDVGMGMGLLPQSLGSPPKVPPPPPPHGAKEQRPNCFLFQTSRKSEPCLKCLINQINCLLPLFLPLHQGNVAVCKSLALRSSRTTVWVSAWGRNGLLEPICRFPGLGCLPCTKWSPEGAPQPWAASCASQSCGAAARLALLWED